MFILEFPAKVLYAFLKPKPPHLRFFGHSKNIWWNITLYEAPHFENFSSTRLELLFPRHLYLMGTSGSEYCTIITLMIVMIVVVVVVVTDFRCDAAR
jgi:hypothetical protein